MTISCQFLSDQFSFSGPSDWYAWIILRHESTITCSCSLSESIFTSLYNSHIGTDHSCSPCVVINWVQTH